MESQREIVGRGWRLFRSMDSMNEVDGILIRRQDVESVLLGYLQAARPCWLPGADGLTIQDALDSYRDAVLAGAAPGLEELSLLHPELAEDLRGFFA